MKAFNGKYLIETNSGRTVCYCDHVEEAEHIAEKGRGRWVFAWFEGKYQCPRQLAEDDDNG